MQKNLSGLVEIAKMKGDSERAEHYLMKSEAIRQQLIHENQLSELNNWLHQKRNSLRSYFSGKLNVRDKEKRHDSKA